MSANDYYLALSDAQDLVYDPSTPAFRQDPYPGFRRLQEQSPLYWVDALSFWVLTRYADIAPLLRDPRLKVIPAELRRLCLGEGPAWDLSVKILGLIDPPDHSRLRGLVGKAFTPRAAEALRPRIQSIVDGLLDALASQPEFDLMASFATPLPVQVISELLGVPTEDTPRFKTWTEALLLLFDSPLLYTDARVDACNTAAAECSLYLTDLIAHKRRHPGLDLISQLIEAESEGDKLSSQEVMQMSANLMLGGYETTLGLIGNGVRALLQHPTQWEMLRAYPELITRAVEEMLRYDSPFIATVRTTSEPIQIGAQRIEAGQILCMVLAAANRDPDRFPEPDRFDITRTTSNLAFGGGIHVCLGASLARVEGEVAIASLVRRFPHLQLQSEPLSWRDSQITRILTRLPVYTSAHT